MYQYSVHTHTHTHAHTRPGRARTDPLHWRAQGVLFPDLETLVEYFTKKSAGQCNPLDKRNVASMERAFFSSAPAAVQPGAMLPGQIMAAQMEAQMRAEQEAAQVCGYGRQMHGRHPFKLFHNFNVNSLTALYASATVACLYV